MHQRKSKKILIYFFLFLIIGSVNNKNFTKFNFPQIDRINIIGLEEKNSFELNNDLNFLLIKNLFLLNKNQINEIIDSNIFVENFSVFKNYPSTLDIRIHKTSFLAYVQKSDGIYFLGSNKKLIHSQNKKKDIPFIFGSFEIDDFFDLKKNIDSSELSYKDIKKLFFFPSRRWDLELNSGIIIKLPKDNLKEILNISVMYLNEQTKKKVKILDMRQTNQIVVNE